MDPSETDRTYKILGGGGVGVVGGFGFIESALFGIWKQWQSHDLKMQFDEEKKKEKKGNK